MSATSTSMATPPPDPKTKVKATTPRYDGTSVPLMVGIYWILPMLFIATLSRFAVDTDPSFLPRAGGGNRQVPLDFSKSGGGEKTNLAPTVTTKSMQPTKNGGVNGKEMSNTGYLANKPASYQEVVKAIGRRRLDWATADTSPMTGGGGGGTAARSSSSGSGSSSSPSSSLGSQTTSSSSRAADTSSSSSSSSSSNPTPPRGASQDPARLELVRLINQLRDVYHNDRSNLLNAIGFADALRMYDVQYHDGGSMQEEAIHTYHEALKLAWEQRNRALEEGEETNRSLSGEVDVNEEIMMEYSARSIDGTLCALYTSLGKTYFMANMFEKAVESYSEALKLEPYYLDAVSSRGSSLIILGDYETAAQDFVTVMERDSKRRYLDVYTGLARVLQAREDVVPGGWDNMLLSINQLIPMMESQVDVITDPEGLAFLGNSLARLYHVLFNYHDSKTKDADSAWESLSKAYHYKMSNLPPWNTGFEAQKIQATKQIFHAGFWPKVGSQSDVPIFIIGFVRSGSTLLERILDAHPDIVGTGENSVFNGQLDMIRNQIVQTSLKGDTNALEQEIERLADEVVEEMKNRWDMVAAGEERAAGRRSPRKYVDKMLTNYYNVGFIHMLFPKALILHVIREPMDTLFSAYKHEFPPGTLDYTSLFDSLAELYHGYRDVMDHWDNVLPGRVMTIRYEDMVEDMPAVAKRIIEAAGLEWNDEILDFHKKKQAVNTLSTTQVRKGIYKDSLQSWRRYEGHLQPLVKLIGDRIHY